MLLHSPSVDTTVFTSTCCMLWLKKQCMLQGSICTYFVVRCGLYPVSTGYQPYREAIAGFLCVSHFSFFLCSFRNGLYPRAPCPGRERLGCLGLSEPYTTGGNGNPLRRCYNYRRWYELLGWRVWPMPPRSTQEHARCLRLKCWNQSTQYHQL